VREARHRWRDLRTLRGLADAERDLARLRLTFETIPRQTPPGRIDVDSFVNRC
jgi:hypothetical protein